MIQRQDEKRHFTRMAVTSNVEFRRENSGKNGQGQAKDLSAAGLRFTTQTELKSGEVLNITIHPGVTITPPLETKLTVLRVRRHREEDLYEVAGTLEH